MVVSQGRPPGDFKWVVEYSIKAKEALRGLNSPISVTVTWSDSEPANAAATALSYTICKQMCPVHLAGYCWGEKKTQNKNTTTSFQIRKNYPIFVFFFNHRFYFTKLLFFTVLQYCTPSQSKSKWNWYRHVAYMDHKISLHMFSATQFTWAIRIIEFPQLFHLSYPFQIL